MTDSSWYEYDWRRRLSHVNMTDFDLTKYDWWRRLGDGGSEDYIRCTLPRLVLGTLIPKHVHLLPAVFFQFHRERKWGMDWNMDVKTKPTLNINIDK